MREIKIDVKREFETNTYRDINIANKGGSVERERGSKGAKTGVSLGV